MSPRLWIIGTLWFLISLPIGVFALLDMDADLRLHYSNSVQLASAYLAFLLCLRTAWRLPTGDSARTTWNLIGFGLLAWALGQTLFFFYPILNDGAETPYPWWSDIGYLLMPPLLITALIQFIRDMGVPLSLGGILSGLVVGSAGLAFAAYGNWADLGGEGIWLPLTAVGYMTFDPVLIGMTVIAASVLSGGLAGRPWWFVVAGITCYYFSNVIYSYYNGLETYATGMASDIGWPLGFGLIALAALMVDELFSET